MRPRGRDLCALDLAAQRLSLSSSPGTLKVKTYRELRDRERDRRVPVLKLGSLYFVWSSAKHHSHKHSPPL
ncbi:hypothetical protein EJ076_15105 [Mesorhizobium sp. M7D.F.Ca.US.005.01.1.1]|nr:hypothetical protein EJ076_15105 [Mesorhizobium sp. M7D.F.Ca.US.005.01.1.1]RUX91158.1 hypothetical protein EN993_28055 [Mesorhizobium sp. M7D.F.Ca.US.004.01.2.1]RVA29378.1 hypothetical protein EN935_16925 [Mesorhizobium sp. M7D.F.Ca.US.004.03.1.1]